MEPLILNQRHHLLQLLRRGTALDELIQDGEHLLLDHGTAFQQDLAHGQHLAVGQAGGLLPGEAVPLHLGIIHHLPAVAPFGKKCLQVVQVPLDAFFGHTKAGGIFLFVDHPPCQKLLLQAEKPVLLAGHAGIVHAIPSRGKTKLVIIFYFSIHVNLILFNIVHNINTNLNTGFKYTKVKKTQSKYTNKGERHG